MIKFSLSSAFNKKKIYETFSKMSDQGSHQLENYIIMVSSKGEQAAIQKL